MSDFRQLTDDVFVSPQIGTAEIDAAVADGVTHIINNRPDDEEAGQPSNDSLADYAKEKGVAWAHIPVEPGKLTLEAIEGTSFALRDAVKVLAFCRTGTRSATLWALAEAFAGKIPTTEIVNHGKEAGYDLADLMPTLEHLRGSAGG